MFLVYTEKSEFSFYFFRKGKKIKFLIVLILPGSAGLVGEILGVNTICT